MFVAARSSPLPQYTQTIPVVWYGVVWYGMVWYGVATPHQGWRKQVPKVPAVPESFYFDGKFCFEV